MLSINLVSLPIYAKTAVTGFQWCNALTWRMYHLSAFCRNIVWEPLSN